MKITIDTKEDSHEDIRKVIRMLNHLVGNDHYTNSSGIFDSSSDSAAEAVSDSANAFSNMFNSESTQTTEEKPKEKESHDDAPQVVPY